MKSNPMPLRPRIQAGIASCIATAVGVGFLQGAQPSILQIPDPGYGHGAIDLVLDIRNDALRTELAITEVQQQKLIQVRHQYQAESAKILRQWISSRRNLDASERTKELPTELTASHHAVLDQIRAVLEPKQYSRLRQIQFQKDLQIRLLLPLLSPQVGAELEFNSEEQNRFNYVVREQHNLLKSARPKLDDAAAAGLDAVLSPEQRTQLTELVGTQLTLGPVAPLEANVPGADLRRLNTVLNHADAKRELELVGEQEEQLARLLEAIIREAGVIHDKARRAEVEAVLRKQQPTFTIEQGFVALNNKVEEELAEILLPHQCRRLKQIRLQFESHEESPIPLLTTAIARELKLSEKQRDQLRAAYIRTWERAEAEFNQQFDKALSTVLDSLTPNQKTRYLSLVGAPFSKTFQ